MMDVPASVSQLLEAKAQLTQVDVKILERVGQLRSEVRAFGVILLPFQEEGGALASAALVLELRDRLDFLTKHMRELETSISQAKAALYKHASVDVSMGETFVTHKALDIVASEIGDLTDKLADVLHTVQDLERAGR